MNKILIDMSYKSYGTRIYKTIAPSLTARDYKEPRMVLEMMEVKIIGQMDNTNDHTFEIVNRVYDKNQLSPTITTCAGGGRQPKIIEETKQKDNLILESKIHYRIRKITPRECWRLMGYTDADFDSAQEAGVSNSQLYKQAGNAIVKQVLMAIFKQMNIKSIKETT